MMEHIFILLHLNHSTVQPYGIMEVGSMIMMKYPEFLGNVPLVILEQNLRFLPFIKV